jgi:hypothetical protein
VHAFQTCSGVSQVHPARLLQRDRGRQVASGTPHAGGLRYHGGVARFLLDPRPPGEDPLHRSAPAAQGITTAGSRDIRAAYEYHACKSLASRAVTKVFYVWGKLLNCAPPPRPKMIKFLKFYINFINFCAPTCTAPEPRAPLAPPFLRLC